MRTSFGWHGSVSADSDGSVCTFGNIPAGQAVGAMFAARSVALVAQPFVMGALLNVADAVAVLILGVFCLLCSVLFFLFTRKTPLAES